LKKCPLCSLLFLFSFFFFFFKLKIFIKFIETSDRQ
jgi:hypothetical protein